jgi:hypothetical protein
MHERAKIEAESQKLDEYIEQKMILAKRLKEAIKKEKQKATGFGDIHSEAASDGGWETLHQEVLSTPCHCMRRLSEGCVSSHYFIKA